MAQLFSLGIVARMKKCTYCGKEYPDEAEVCAIDQQPLVRDGVSFKQKLIDANLHDEFVITIQKRNQIRMIGLLEEIGMSYHKALLMSGAILAAPKRYGY